jgi:hypothetical protein
VDWDPLSTQGFRYVARSMPQAGVVSDPLARLTGMDHSTGALLTPARTRLDALVGICRHWLESPAAPTRGGGGHPHVIVTHTERRFFTFPQRRAMIARDGDRCPWPWFDRPATWSDGHHLIWSTRAGPTTIDNGALPCPAHHTQCHEGGWTLHRLPDGRYTATHRDGRTLGPEPHPPGRNRPPTSRPPPQRE